MWGWAARAVLELLPGHIEALQVRKQIHQGRKGCSVGTRSGVHGPQHKPIGIG